MNKVRVSLWPDRWLEVDDYERADLEYQGLIVEVADETKQQTHRADSAHDSGGQ